MAVGEGVAVDGWRPVGAEAWAAAHVRRGRADPAVAERVRLLLEALRAGGADGLLRIEGALRADPACGVAEALRRPPLPLEAVAVPAAVLAAAPAAVSAELVAALTVARARLMDFMGPGCARPYSVSDAAGNQAALMRVPLDTVGVFAPGGRAPYPSSVLMAVVPARVAGVREVCVCTPCAAGGGADPAVLAAAAVAGADRVFLLGPVQAVAAMAWGLGPVPRVDKVAGPGGPWVVEAKRQLYGEVGIDGLPGPSEIVVLASAGADPGFVAADLVAQAEHGPDGLALLVTDAPDLAAAVGECLAAALLRLPAQRAADARQTIRASGGPVVVGSLREGLALAERLAPEHLSLQGAAAEALAASVRAAGAVFVGAWSPVAAGDYAGGTDHILPTAGAARWGSGLSPADFTRSLQVFTGVRDGVRAWAGPAETLAEVEGFPGHAASIRLRRERAGAEQMAAAAPPPDAPYVPPVPPGAVRLDLNENPFPWPEPLWEDVLARLRVAEPTRYPRATARLQEALAVMAGVPPTWCLPGNGSDELIVAAIGAWGHRAVRALFPVPTFGMYRRLAEASGLPAVPVPLGPPPDFALPVETLLAEARRGGESLLFLCRPNNPTGTVWPAADIRRLVEAEGLWVVVDEAYVEFAGAAAAAGTAAGGGGAGAAGASGGRGGHTAATGSGLVPSARGGPSSAEGGSVSALLPGLGLAAWLPDCPRLILLRTLSKAYAFAGLRVGYALGRPDALAPLRAAVQPWSIDTFSCAAAMAVLGEPSWRHAVVPALVAERERLSAALARLPGLDPYPSQANYILFGVGADSGWDAFELFDRLYAQGVVIRRWQDEPLLRHALRVSVGRREENDRFLAVLARALGEPRAGRA